MVLYFNKRDLISFGNYLLSDERRELYANHPELGDNNLDERLANVNHSDIENWMAGLKK